MSFTGRTDDFLNSIIANNGFFPDLAVGEFQQLHRIPSHYADDSIVHHLTLAMGHINIGLATKQDEWALQGYTALQSIDEAVPGARVTFYKAAVYYRAKANLLADFQTFSRRDIAADQARESESILQSLLAESIRALRKLQGESTTIDVELL